MAHDAEPALQPVATAELRVERDDRGYEVLDRGDRLAVVTTPRAVLDTVFARVHRRAFELAPTTTARASPRCSTTPWRRTHPRRAASS
ncbi:MAG: hypothetical protein ACO1PW_09960, partial [Actinomycetota bacterium]